MYFYFQEENKELKKTAAQNNFLLKKSSLDIPLLPEREEDKKMASLLSMKLISSKSVAENMDTIRKNVLSQSCLPTSGFSPSKELKAIKILSNQKQTVNVIVKRKEENTVNSNDLNKDTKKIKLINSLVEDYGSSSSDSG